MEKLTGVYGDRDEPAGARGTEAGSDMANSQRRAPGSTGKRAAELAWAVNSDRHRFAAKVRAGRAVLGWSQTDLARRAGLSQRSIYRLELAAVDVRRSTVVALETVFWDAGIGFEQLADGGFSIVVAGPQAIRQ